MQDGTAQPERETVRHSFTSHSLSLTVVYVRRGKALVNYR